jgi:hypothetical protein
VATHGAIGLTRAIADPPGETVPAVMSALHAIAVEFR